MIKKAVILCGGLATRFLPLSKSLPKEMLPILSRPAIDYCIEDLKNNNITDILIVLGRNKECIENYYDRNIELENRLNDTNKQKELEMLNNIISGINITFIRQVYAKGTGYAVGLAKNFVGNDPFILVFPDEIMLGDSFARQLLSAYDKNKSSTLALAKIDIKDCSKYGMVAMNGSLITDIVEKPLPENSPSDVCYLGGGVFTPEIFDEIGKCPIHSNGEIYITDAFKYLIEKNRLCGAFINGERLDFGNPLGFVKGNILAGLRDDNIKDELVSFMKNIIK